MSKHIIKFCAICNRKWPHQETGLCGYCAPVPDQGRKPDAEPEPDVEPDGPRRVYRVWVGK